MSEEEAKAKIEAARQEEREKAQLAQQELENKIALARKEERERVLAEEARKNEIAAFAQKVTMGKRAMPQKPDELAALLADTPDDVRVRWQAVLDQLTTGGLVDLSEIGTSQGAQFKQLSAEQAAALKVHLAGKGKIETFFAANADLGALDEYDLTAFGVKRD